jgi:hypothetical protein
MTKISKNQHIKTPVVKDYFVGTDEKIKKLISTLSRRQNLSTHNGISIVNYRFMTSEY